MEATPIRTLPKAAVAKLDDEVLLERAELLYEACVSASDDVLPVFRQQLDWVTSEGERRRLICWRLPELPVAKRKKR